MIAWLVYAAENARHDTEALPALIAIPFPFSLVAMAAVIGLLFCYHCYCYRSTSRRRPSGTVATIVSVYIASEVTHTELGN